MKYNRSKLRIHWSQLRAWCYALAVHAVLLLFVCLHLPTSARSYAKRQQPSQLIQAQAAPEAEVKHAVDRIKAREKAKQQQLKQLQQQADSAKRQAQRAEKQRRQALYKMKRELRKLKQQQAKQNRSLAHKRRLNQRVQKQLHTLQTQRSQLKKQLNQLKQQLQTEQRKAKIQELRSQLSAEKKSAEQQAALQKQMDQYRAKIIQSVSQHWLVPHDVQKNLRTRLLVRVAPGGKVLSVQIVKSSGNAVLDRSAKVAVLKASPLPVPQKREYFAHFRKIYLTVRPEKIRKLTTS